jgi:hypothetical protein
MDIPYRDFLAQQYREGRALAAESDVVALRPVAGDPPDKYIATFRTRGLVREADGQIREAEGFVVGIAFRSNYLAHVNPLELVTWLGPENVWHPNAGRGPFHFGPVLLCIGRIAPGTGLVTLLYQIHDVLRYANYTLVETDALNFEACQWARKNVHRFPISSEPLRRRPSRDADYSIEEIGPASA